MPQDVSLDTKSGLEETLRISFPSNSATLRSVRFDLDKFNRIAEKIADKTYSIRSLTQDFEKALRLIGTKDDSKNLRDELEKVQVTTTESITAIMKDLETLKNMLNKRQEPGGKEKFRIERLSRDLKDFVKIHSDMQKQIVAKMRSNFLRQSRASEGLPMDSAEEILRINSAGQAQHEAQMLEAEIELENELLLEREERILDLERNIIDVNEIMKCLATMVLDQGDTVDLIESHVEETLVNVETGTAELATAVKSQTKIMKCKLILLGTSAIGLLTIITILVIALKN